MENDIINKNYAEFLKLPKKEKVEKQTFSELEIIKIYIKAEEVEWADTILILIYTGMRISELIGLTRFNVDIEKKIITGGVKTEAGKNRQIPIHPIIYPFIEKWYNKNGNYLICNEKGNAIPVRKYREEYYYPTLEKLEVRKLNPHCCRHTFASLMHDAGAETFDIQKLIGHSDYSTTANIYTHTDIEKLRKTIQKI